ncbi:sigma 54-interacting transcriptional regulator [Peribacillus cavernae]|nr:transcriptional regulator with PAS, ATPase and Fis domain [Peribacillus cavernae]
MNSRNRESFGAFTGSRKGGAKGKFEIAHYGTIFLDEMGDLRFTA